MTELSYAKTFLSTLDGRSTKLSQEHTVDPRTYPSRTPYTLPKTSHPLPKRARLAPGQAQALTVSVKSLRNPPLDITLDGQSPELSVLDLKNAVAQQAGLALDKLRLLHKKKPVADSKILSDLASETDTTIEFSLMVIGGGTSSPAPAASTPVDEPAAAVAQGESGAAVLETDAFWGDLKGFLTQRLRDEEQADAVYEVFKGAWQMASSTS